MSRVNNLLKVMIKSQCANYCENNNGISNSCLKADCVCKYFTNSEELTRCRYLEESMLPDENNNAVRTLYYASLDAEREGRTINNKAATNIIKAASRQIECERCKKAFKPSNNRQIYCERCSKIIRREHQRDLMQNRREKEGEDSCAIL